MNELDQELARRLSEVRDEHDASAPRWTPGVKREVMRRTRRRRTVKTAGTAVVTAALVAAAFVVAPWAGFGDAPIQAAARSDEGEALGLWPAVTESEARRLCGSLDLRIPLAAGGLIGETLTWGEVAASVVDEASDRDRRTLRYTLVGRTFGATGPVGTLPGSDVPTDASALVEVTRLDEDCWWATSLTATNEAGVDVHFDGDSLRVDYDLPQGTSSADVIVVEQGASQRRYVTGRPGETTAEVESFEGPGYVVVLWKRADGWVVTGESRTVRARS